MRQRRSIASAVVAGAILLELLAAGLWAPIDGGSVCLLRRAAGIPCPTCGMTRSVVLTLRGDPAAAFAINPAGPLWVLAALTLSAGLLWFAWRPGERAKRRLVMVALAQGFTVAAVLAVHWVRAISRAAL
ncbi:MAG: DUF2752 domain-containing protein [Acidobacteriota bacterium]